MSGEFVYGVHPKHGLNGRGGVTVMNWTRSWREEDTALHGTRMTVCHEGAR